MPQDQHDPRLGNIKVLVVDANRHVRQIMRNILGGLGVRQIVSAMDGQSAVKEMGTFPPDIIFTGYVMKPVDGIALTRAVRAGETPAEATTPIIMVSTHTEVTNIISARDSGVTEFLAKPVSSKMVWLRVRAVLEHPRPFVQSQNFYGPDRRRRDIQRSGSDRRKRPYEYTAAMRRSERRGRDGSERT